MLVPCHLSAGTLLSLAVLCDAFEPEAQRSGGFAAVWLWLGFLQQALLCSVNPGFPLLSAFPHLGQLAEGLV